MMPNKIFLLLLVAMMYRICCSAQEAAPGDTLHAGPLPEVTVHAYSLQADLLEAPTALGLLSPALLKSYPPQSLTAALNSLPGIRLEERSPGSYRLNIRGSSLRSPFGVRNVKVYYDGIPFTDPGGNTYFNQLGYYNIASAELIKGPGSSLYGAGTGGVLLIESMPDSLAPGITALFGRGSYGHLQAMGEWRSGSSEQSNIVRYQHQSSDGYRDQSALRRDVLSWDTRLQLRPRTLLETHFLYGDLYYQTPGALTLTEYEADPRSARPASGSTPGAADLHTAVYQKTFLAGFSLHHQYNEHWQVQATAYGLYAQLRNPTLRNYSETAEPNAGGRGSIHFQQALAGGWLEAQAGAEYQQNFSTAATYSNQNGQPGVLQTNDAVQSRQLLGFAQASWRNRHWVLTGGLSLTQLRFFFARKTDTPYREQTRSFSTEPSPRLALLYRVSSFTSVYASVSRGFSPPASTELVPTGSSVNLDLQPEYGWNDEAGLRGYLWHQRLFYDLNAYYFHLTHTIVQRRDSAAGDYYVNSGSTRQPGLEAALRCALLPSFLPTKASAWLSYSYQPFRYQDFRQIGNNYSGKELPGIPQHTLAAGIDLQLPQGFSLYLNYYYNSRAALNDVNTAWLEAYHLLGLKAGYNLKLRRTSLELFAGGDNLLNTRYVAGADINAAGERYYNAAAGRNFYAGLQLNYSTPKTR